MYLDLNLERNRLGALICKILHWEIMAKAPRYEYVENICSKLIFFFFFFLKSKTVVCWYALITQTFIIKTFFTKEMILADLQRCLCKSLFFFFGFVCFCFGLFFLQKLNLSAEGKTLILHLCLVDVHLWIGLHCTSCIHRYTCLVLFHRMPEYRLQGNFRKGLFLNFVFNVW